MWRGWRLWRARWWGGSNGVVVRLGSCCSRSSAPRLCFGAGTESTGTFLEVRRHEGGISSAGVQCVWVQAWGVGRGSAGEQVRIRVRSKRERKVDELGLIPQRRRPSSSGAQTRGPTCCLRPSSSHGDLVLRESRRIRDSVRPANPVSSWSSEQRKRATTNLVCHPAIADREEVVVGAGVPAESGVSDSQVERKTGGRTSGP